MYSRLLEGRELHFGASGWVYINTFVLTDYQTLSLWYPFVDKQELQCVSGVYADKSLKSWPAELTEWADWRRKHPRTKLLKRISISPNE